MDTHIADLTGLVQTASLRDVTLVGHSGANMAVTGAADLLGDRVARVVYVDSGPMPSGMASIDFHAPQAQPANIELERVGEPREPQVPGRASTRLPSPVAPQREHSTEAARSR